MDKASVTQLLGRSGLPVAVKEVLEIRRQVGKSSTAKYEAILNYASPVDQRMRGMLQYHAAGPGRWGGRGPQPQNFPKGLGFDSASVCDDIERLSPAEFWAKYQGRSMDALSAALRGILVAGPGKVSVVPDYSSIEARVLFWEAGDTAVLAKYKMGVNLYVDMARFIYNDFTIEKKTHPEQYAIGKAAILGCGYQMGKDRFKGTCAGDPYYVDIPIELADTAVKAFRKKYKLVVEMWYAQEAAARHAITSPGSIHPCGKVVWGMDPKREFLVCKLPSGRHLRYFRPSVKPIETPYGEKQEIHYWAAASQSPHEVIALEGELEQFKTYGGSLVENITQATARDIMANGMLNAEAAGYPVILTVHDELVTEVKENSGKNVEGLIKAMCTLPAWAEGCPITAEGWEGRRYRK